MGLTNLISLGTTSHSTSNTYNRTGSVSGAVANVYDGNDSTYYKIFNVASGGGQEDGRCTLTSQHIWTTPVTLSNVRVKMYTRCYSLGNYANRGSNPRNLQQIFLLIGGTWTNVWQFRSSYSGGDTQPNETISTDQTVSTGWASVTGVKVFCEANSYAYEGNRYNDTTCQVFEIEAYGLIDSRIRVYDGASVVKIGSELLNSTHKLRMYNGSSVVGVPLVNTSEAYASDLRLYDGSIVQSLPKVT